MDPCSPGHKWAILGTTDLLDTYCQLLGSAVNLLEDKLAGPQHTHFTTQQIMLSVVKMALEMLKQQQHTLDLLPA